MKTDGIIFDVDGTLWDSTEIVAGAWNRAIAEEGIADIALDAEILKGLFGKTMDVIAESVIPGATKNQRENIMERCCVYEHEALRENDVDITYPNVVGTIRRLAKRLPLFIVSNCQSGYIELFLEKTGLRACVRDSECFGDTGLQKGENIRLLVERNGLKRAVYVGDTRGDYEACAQAGLPMIFAEYGFGEVPECERRIRGFEELEGMFAFGENHGQEEKVAEEWHRRVNY